MIYTPPIGGHHPVLYFPFQIQRNIVQRCVTGHTAECPFNYHFIQSFNLFITHQGECFCGNGSHSDDCPDLVAGLAEPAMMVNNQHPFNIPFNSSYFILHLKCHTPNPPWWTDFICVNKFRFYTQLCYYIPHNLSYSTTLFVCRSSPNLNFMPGPLRRADGDHPRAVPGHRWSLLAQLLPPLSFHQ